MYCDILWSLHVIVRYYEILWYIMIYYHIINIYIYIYNKHIPRQGFHFGMLHTSQTWPGFMTVQGLLEGRRGQDDRPKNGGVLGRFTWFSPENRVFSPSKPVRCEDLRDFLPVDFTRSLDVGPARLNGASSTSIKYPLVMTHSLPWYRWPIEIDVFPSYKPPFIGDSPWLC